MTCPLLSRKVDYRITRSRHWSLLWARWIKSKTPHFSFFKINFNTNLQFTPETSKSIFFSDFSTKIVYAFLISPLHVTHPTHLIPLHFIPVIGRLFGDLFKLRGPWWNQHGLASVNFVVQYERFKLTGIGRYLRFEHMHFPNTSFDVLYNSLSFYIHLLQTGVY
jgi:hypothetical protein